MREANGMGPLRLALTAALSAAALVVLTPLAGTATATKAGLYSRTQAAAGAKAYAANCASCHGVKLQGGMGPPLKGATAPYHGTETVGDVYEAVSTQMPLNKPGSLSPATYVAIIAYLMQQNGHPAGSKPLAPAAAARATEKM
jgi:mono/diheme cytochrome c family protein